MIVVLLRKKENKSLLCVGQKMGSRIDLGLGPLGDSGPGPKRKREEERALACYRGDEESLSAGCLRWLAAMQGEPKEVRYTAH